MQTLKWLRVPGDVLFATGVVALVWFVARLRFTGAGVRVTNNAGDVLGGLEPDALPAGALSMQAETAARLDA